jgi:hypothetical protein
MTHANGSVDLAKFHNFFVDLDNLDGSVLEPDTNLKVINPGVRGVA